MSTLSLGPCKSWTYQCHYLYRGPSNLGPPSGCSSNCGYLTIPRLCKPFYVFKQRHTAYSKSPTTTQSINQVYRYLSPHPRSSRTPCLKADTGSYLVRTCVP